MDLAIDADTRERIGRLAELGRRQLRPLGLEADRAGNPLRSLPRRLSRGGAVAVLATLLFFFGVCIPYFHYYGGRP